MNRLGRGIDADGGHVDSDLASDPNRQVALGRVRFWARLLAFFTFPLIWLGGLVTTQDAGMAVPDWPGTFGYNLWLYPISTWLLGPFDLFVEHGHRLLATFVGLLAICLVGSAWRPHVSRSMRWWSVAVLAAVIGQGILGGLRVRLDERVMAMIHGCTGPLFFAMAVATAVWAGTTWNSSKLQIGQPISARWVWMSRAVLAAVLTQLVLGAQVRHIVPWALPSQFTFWVHLHLTFAAVVSILILAAWLGRWSEPLWQSPAIRWPVDGLAALLLLQLSLGVATWFVSYASPWPISLGGLDRYVLQAKGYFESWVITGHQATGSLLIGLSTAWWLWMGEAGQRSGIQADRSDSTIARRQSVGDGLPIGVSQAHGRIGILSTVSAGENRDLG